MRRPSDSRADQLICGRMNTPIKENNMVIEFIALFTTAFTTVFTLVEVQLMLKGR